MDQRTKRRLVGTAVLVLLAVVFLPMLFSGPEQEEETVDVPLEVPPRSEEPEEPEAFEVPEDFPAEAAPAESEADGEETADRPERETPEPDARPDGETADEETAAGNGAIEEQALEEVPEDGAYAAQVGSYSSEDNARTERDRLREMGFPAYIEPLGRDGDDDLHRVRVGPVIERREAEELLQRLREQADLDGYVTRQQ